MAATSEMNRYSNYSANIPREIPATLSFQKLHKMLDAGNECFKRDQELSLIGKDVALCVERSMRSVLQLFKL